MSSMSWSFAQARKAADDVHSAPLGDRAQATLRPRSVLGIVRTRAPLPLLLYVAAHDGLVVEQDKGGFALIQWPWLRRPPNRTGGYRLRFLRWLDRHWDTVLFAGPPTACLLTALLMAVFAVARLAAVVPVLLGVLWLVTFMAGMMVFQLSWLFRLGARPTPLHSRSAESLPADNWSMPLLHQPDVDRVEELLRSATDRMSRLIHTSMKVNAGQGILVSPPGVGRTLDILVSGITTERTRIATAESLRALKDEGGDGGVIRLAPQGRMEEVAPRAQLGGGVVVLLYLVGMALVIGSLAHSVSQSEARSCLPATCDGRPATYSSALRWLLQRLLLTDPPGIAPANPENLVAGWLVSVAAIVFVLVLYVAARHEIKLGRWRSTGDQDFLHLIQGRGRVLILVVTDEEREAVTAAVHRRDDRTTVPDNNAQRTMHILGTVAGTELLLIQASEQGTLGTGGMLVTAREAISQCRPDYVVLTGICFGLRRDDGQQIGDIVISRRVQGLDHEKVIDEDGRTTIYRGKYVGSSAVLLDRFQAEIRNWKGARVHCGTVLSSNTVVNSLPVIRKLRAEFPDAIAGEMEALGVYEACSEGVKPDWIMVKGISDWGHGKKDHGHATAAANAAEFVLQVVAAGGLSTRRR
jgi:nucleoside phosphorylase